MSFRVRPARPDDVAAIYEMAELTGGAEWHLRSSYISTGSWSGYTQMFKTYIGQTYHDGYLSKQTYEGWKRTRTQTEYSYWDHFVRV